MTSTEKNHTSNQTSTCPLTQHTPGSCASRCVLWRTALLPSQTHTPTFPLLPGENLCSERVESYRWSPECTHHSISAGPLAHLHCFTITCLSINTYITTRQCISSEGTCIMAGILPGWHNLKIPVVRGDQEVRGYWHLMMTHRDTYNRYRQSASTLNMSSISLINLSWGLHLSLSPLHTLTSICRSWGTSRARGPSRSRTSVPRRSRSALRTHRPLRTHDGFTFWTLQDHVYREIQLRMPHRILKAMHNSSWKCSLTDIQLNKY